jgi:hypothetical protein
VFGRRAHDILKSISSCAQYVTLQKYFSQPSLVIYFFSNPTHKTKIGIARMSETNNSNPPGPIKLSSQSTTTAVRFLGAFLPASTSCAKIVGQNHFAELNWHVLTFLHPIFFCKATTY